MDLRSQSTTDVLLFIARTFFLPPKDTGILNVSKVDMSSMNGTVSSKHPWVTFLRSLSSLCTLKATGNNVFAVMLLPSGGLAGEPTTTTNVDKVQFLCADNWDEDPIHNLKGLPHFVEDCLEKILQASFDVDIGGSNASKKPMEKFIVHVYSNGWKKFCGRMMKAGNRGDRILDTLRQRQMSGAQPAGVHAFIEAVSSVMTVINNNKAKNKMKKSHYLKLHSDCTAIYKAISNHDMERWIARLRFSEQQGQDSGPGPVMVNRVLQKMVKLRNGIECLRKLILSEEMKPTFRAARAAVRLERTSAIQWLQAPQLTQHNAVEVNLHEDATDFKAVYINALSSRLNAERRNYATAEEVWERIQANMENARQAQHGRGWELKDDRTTFSYIPDGPPNQHCEGKLLRHVIGSEHDPEHNLLGKVFPYIGCSKLCCQPCFTAIRAVNELLQEKLHHDFKFTAEGSHRKIYPGFAITPTAKLAEEDLTERFNTILCCDIGTMVKAGAEKGLGHSDSAPEPGSGDDQEEE